MLNAILNGIFVILGAIIGSASTIITTSIAEKRKNMDEINRSNREKQAQAYLKVIKALLPLNSDSPGREDYLKAKKVLNDCIPEIQLYGTKRVITSLSTLAGFVENNTLSSDFQVPITSLIYVMREEILGNEKNS